MTTLPDQLTRSLTWDLGHEMAEQRRCTGGTGIKVYFCGASNENTNACSVSTCPGEWTSAL